MTTADRLRKARQELDECAAWLDRITRDVESAEAETTMPSIVGPSEAAEILGINADAFTKRRIRGTLPEPIAELGCGTIWMRRDIERMAEVAA